MRGLEVLGLALAGLIAALLGARLVGLASDFPLAVTAGALAGLLLADFLSGLAHWLCDTFGSPETPLVGRALIHDFREHHVDPQAITRHDLVATNGANCLASLPLATLALWLPATGRLAAAAVALLAAAFLALAVTNQVHKWAHARRVPRLVAALQRRRLLLDPRHHAAHHRPPHTGAYCITGGWLDAPLDAIDFFGRLERLARRDSAAARPTAG